MGGDEPMIPDATPGGRPRCAAKRKIAEAIAVSAARRLLMAAAAARFPAVANGLPLPAPLVAGRRLGEGSSHAGHGGPRARVTSDKVV